MALTTNQVKYAKAGRHADGNGLYLFVKPSGAKSWVLRVQADGKRQDFGLGSVILERKVPTDVPVEQRRELTLAEARDKAAAGRSLAKAGRNPSQEWKRQKNEIPNFEGAAREYYGNIKGGFRNDRHSASWLSSLEAYAFPVIGELRVDAVDATEIHKALAPIWLTIPETARRVRQRIGKVLDYAKAKKWRADEAPMRSVSAMLPKHGSTDNHFAAMGYSELPSFMRLLESKADTIGRLAVRFTILTAARSGETRGATWDEMDLEAKVWNIPGNRMKAGKPHSVPLSEPALDILKTMAGFIAGEKGELIFKGVRGKPLSDMTLTKALRDAGMKEFTVHGFRSSFRDWVAEQTSFPGEWAEAALAHALPSKTEAAYRRTKFLEQRRKMMEAWADYLQGASNVFELAGKRA